MPIYSIGAQVIVSGDLFDVERAKAELYIENLATKAKVSFGFKARPADHEGMSLISQNLDGTWTVPRGYRIPWKQPTPQPERIAVWAEQRSFPKFRRTLRPGQLAASDALVENPGDKILCLGCGMGKTSLALWYAGMVKRASTLIIVDTDFLKDQWLAEIEACYGIKAEDVGLVQGPIWRFGRHFTIASLATLRNAGHQEHFYANKFGLVIVDECHVMGAPQAIPIIARFGAERLGLSATPERKDGMHPAFAYHMGGLRYCFVNIEKRQRSKYIFRELPALLNTIAERTCYLPFFEGGKRKFRFSRSRFESLVAKSPLWCELITNDLIKAQAADRNVLLLGGNVQQLHDIGDRLTALGIDHGIVHGSVKPADRKEAFKKRLILATKQLAGKALDIPRLDTLILLFPEGNEGFLRQAVGRTDRVIGNGSSVLTYLHNYCGPVQRLEAKMLSAIKQIDKGATITRVA